MNCRRFALGVGLVTGFALAGSLQAQDRQVLARSRQVRGEENLRVSVEFASGFVALRPSVAGMLYQAEMTYDADHFDAKIRYDASARRLNVSLSTRGTDAAIDVDEDSPQRLGLALAPDVPIDLEMTMGATASDIELGGIALRWAEITTGASETTIQFSEPNTIACERFETSVGAARLTIENLGNAGCARMEVRGGVGDLTVDLTGSWGTQRNRLSITVGLGQLTIRIPTGLGVRVNLDRFLASFDRVGFSRQGGYYISDGYDSAPTKLDVDIEAVFGNVDVVWLDGRGR